MDYHFPVPGSVGEEKVILFTRKHWAAFLGQFVLSVALILIPIIIALFIHFSGKIAIVGIMQHFLVLGLSTYYLIILTYAFTAWLSFYYDIYVITQDAVTDVTQQGFFGRKISQLSLLRVQDVTSNVQGVFATFFGYGNVLVETAGEQSQNFLIRSIPRPQQVCAKIMELHDQIIAAQGRSTQVTSGEGTLNANIGPSATPAEPVPTAPVAPTAPAATTETPYQRMLREQSAQASSPNPPENLPPPANPPEPVAPSPTEPSEVHPKPENPKNNNQEGEVDNDHLNQGGTINLS
jgi:hypothetical protein